MRQISIAIYTVYIYAYISNSNIHSAYPYMFVYTFVCISDLRKCNLYISAVSAPLMLYCIVADWKLRQNKRHLIFMRWRLLSYDLQEILRYFIDLRSNFDDFLKIRNTHLAFSNCASFILSQSINLWQYMHHHGDMLVTCPYIISNIIYSSAWLTPHI